MSIETCSFLRPSLRAKLQDAGFIFVDDLLPLFHGVTAADGASSSPPADGGEGSAGRRATASVGAPAEATRSPRGASVLHCGEALEKTLRERLPLLTAEERADLVASVTGYLVDLSRRSGPRPSTTTSVDDGQPTAAPSPSPFFVVRTLGEIEHEVGLPSRLQPPRLRGPTHATTFCRGLDLLLGVSDVPGGGPVTAAGAPAAGTANDDDNDGDDDDAQQRRRRRRRAEGGKGVEVGKITEISGPPGVGKTQALMQLAVSCAMPVELGGLGGHALFIDTEGSFTFERFREIALAAVSVVRDLVRRRRPGHDATPQQTQNTDGRGSTTTTTTTTATTATATSTQATPLDVLAQSFTIHAVLDRVHYVRVADTAAFMAVLYSVPAWVEERGDDFALKMILVDSVAGPFRALGGSNNNNSSSNCTTTMTTAGTVGAGGLSEVMSWRQRSRLLFIVGERLQAYAVALNAAVVVSNQVTAKTARRPQEQQQSALSSSARGNGPQSPPPPPARRRRFENDDNDCCSDGDEDERATAVGARAGGGSWQRRGGGEGAAEDDWITYLVPALGDSWASHVSTRLLFTYHHYALPYLASSKPSLSEQAVLDRVLCAEDIVMGRRSEGGGGGEGPQMQPAAVAQHRVARLVKHDCNPRGECCFVISRKGIRDAPSR